jgi:hypothetical protein
MRDAGLGHLFRLQGKDLARVFGRFCVNNPKKIWKKPQFFECGGGAAALEDCKLSLDETFGWHVDTVKAAASLSHSKLGRCGLVKEFLQLLFSKRLDVSPYPS